MAPWDPNEAAIETWIETTDGFDRVEAVVQQTREPETAATIAEHAHVSESTARKHLSRLVDLGVASAVQTGRGTRYVRNEDHYLMERVADLQREYTREELVDEIAEMKADVDAYRDCYGIDSPEELAIAPESADEATEDADGREPWSDVADWQATRTNLAIAQTALSFKRARDLANA